MVRILTFGSFVAGQFDKDNLIRSKDMTHNKKALAMAVATSILLWGCGQPQQAEPKAAAPAAKQEAAKPLSKADVKLLAISSMHSAAWWIRRPALLIPGTWKLPVS